LYLNVTYQTIINIQLIMSETSTVLPTYKIAEK